MNATVTALNPAPQIFQVPYWDIENIWYEVSPFIKKAIDVQDEWTLEGVKNAVLIPNGNTQLWYIKNSGAIVTQINKYQTGVTKCLLFLGGGMNLHENLDTYQVIESWAKKYFGCHKMIIHGRPGWEKALTGFKRTTVCLEKDI